jgi:hypothetical protein
MGVVGIGLVDLHAAEAVAQDRVARLVALTG